jgi:hypothetical protein
MGHALLGSPGKMLMLASTWDRIAIALYPGLGWIGVVMFQPLAASVTPVSPILLALGGAPYTIGIIFHPVALAALSECHRARVRAGRHPLPLWRGDERPFCLARADLDTVDLLFHPVKGIVADLAARAHGEDRAASRIRGT